MRTTTPVRYSIKINGIVQGVGFRPFIYNLAKEYELSGFVNNTGSGVFIEIEGDEQNLNKFIQDIPLKAPAISEITNFEYSEIPYSNDKNFRIVNSFPSLKNETLISPDISICDDCRNELFEKSNSRYLYPFINCTNCGPRFTIIKDIPYDRQFTVMSEFEMCAKCSSEFDNPLDRRYHAQPIACELCGPKLWLVEDNNITYESLENIFEQLAGKLINGNIAAIKGIGGFHLAVDAADNNAVIKLRERKNREAKPLAIMVEDIESARKFVEVDYESEMLLNSPQRPIVLLNKIDNNLLAESIAPNNKKLGVMLPYTPLHYLIFYFLKKRYSNGYSPAVVMTSGNISEEPIAINNIDARKRLADIADIFLFHNRDILIRSDDSVVIPINGLNRIIRRSRGYVPKPLFVSSQGSNVLALGGELKNTVCVLKNDKAFVSQHIGDITNLSAFEFFKETVEHLQKIVDAKAEYLAHDMHPEYMSSKFAKEQNTLPAVQIQHHHAHMASCMAENKIEEDVIGLILDGTGYGYDNTIWGGEILIGNYYEVQRFAHLETMPLPGGDSASKEPWRIALSYLYNSFDKNINDFNLFQNRESKILFEMIDKNINCPLTSSTGRLFDAVSAMSGGPIIIKYEAEAAIALMQSIKKLTKEKFEFETIREDNNGSFEIPVKKLIRSIYNAVQNDLPVYNIAAAFHNTLAEMFIQGIILAREKTNINKVVLSGGVFQNEIISTLIENGLSNRGFETFIQTSIPVNDGGISLGQAVIARNVINRNLEKVNYIK